MGLSRESANLSALTKDAGSENMVERHLVNHIEDAYSKLLIRKHNNASCKYFIKTLTANHILILKINEKEKGLAYCIGPYRKVSAVVQLHGVHLLRLVKSIETD